MNWRHPEVSSAALLVSPVPEFTSANKSRTASLALYHRSLHSMIYGTAGRKLHFTPNMRPIQVRSDFGTRTASHEQDEPSPRKYCPCNCESKTLLIVRQL